MTEQVPAWEEMDVDNGEKEEKEEEKEEEEEEEQHLQLVSRFKCSHLQILPIGSHPWQTYKVLCMTSFEGGIVVYSGWVRL